VQIHSCHHTRHRGSTLGTELDATIGKGLVKEEEEEEGKMGEEEEEEEEEKSVRRGGTSGPTTVYAATSTALFPFLLLLLLLLLLFLQLTSVLRILAFSCPCLMDSFISLPSGEMLLSAPWSIIFHGM